ncbi:MAG: hypothetical protein ACLFTA_03185 [Candidatus Nanohaloarchaea archaeon]
MGRTNQTYRNRLEKLKESFKPFRQALRREDRKHLDALWEKAFYHASASSYMNPRNPAETALISIQVEQEKEIHRLKQRMGKLEEQMECSR